MTRLVLRILNRRNLEFSKLKGPDVERGWLFVRWWPSKDLEVSATWGFLLDLGWLGAIARRFRAEHSSVQLLAFGFLLGKIFPFRLLSYSTNLRNWSMETLVAVARRRNYGGSRGKSQISDGFIASPSGGFRGINCRAFQSGVGILPVPSHGLASFASPRPTKQRPSPFYSERSKQPSLSSPISISPRSVLKGTSLSDELYDSERWAGPAYSNSPPPSSLPIPKFSLRQRRSVSLELPRTNSGIETQPFARSAPPSPTRDLCSSTSDLLFNINLATQDLRRILHLDITDD